MADTSSTREQKIRAAMERGLDRRAAEAYVSGPTKERDILEEAAAAPEPRRQDLPRDTEADHERTLIDTATEYASLRATELRDINPNISDEDVYRTVNEELTTEMEYGGTNAPKFVIEAFEAADDPEKDTPAKRAVRVGLRGVVSITTPESGIETGKERLERQKEAARRYEDMGLWEAAGEVLAAEPLGEGEEAMAARPSSAIGDVLRDVAQEYHGGPESGIAGTVKGALKNAAMGVTGYPAFKTIQATRQHPRFEEAKDEIASFFDERPLRSVTAATELAAEMSSQEMRDVQSTVPFDATWVLQRKGFQEGIRLVESQLGPVLLAKPGDAIVSAVTGLPPVPSPAPFDDFEDELRSLYREGTVDSFHQLAPLIDQAGSVEQVAPDLGKIKLTEMPDTAWVKQPTRDDLFTYVRQTPVEDLPDGPLGRLAQSVRDIDGMDVLELAAGDGEKTVEDASSAAWRDFTARATISDLPAEMRAGAVTLDSLKRGAKRKQEAYRATGGPALDYLGASLSSVAAGVKGETLFGTASRTVGSAAPAIFEELAASGADQLGQFLASEFGADYQAVRDLENTSLFGRIAARMEYADTGFDVVTTDVLVEGWGLPASSPVVTGMRAAAIAADWIVPWEDLAAAPATIPLGRLYRGAKGAKALSGLGYGPAARAALAGIAPEAINAERWTDAPPTPKNMGAIDRAGRTLDRLMALNDPLSALQFVTLDEARRAPARGVDPIKALPKGYRQSVGDVIRKVTGLDEAGVVAELGKFGAQVEEAGKAHLDNVQAVLGQTDTDTTALRASQPYRDHVASLDQMVTLGMLDQPQRNVMLAYMEGTAHRRKLAGEIPNLERHFEDVGLRMAPTQSPAAPARGGLAERRGGHPLRDRAHAESVVRQRFGRAVDSLLGAERLKIVDSVADIEADRVTRGMKSLAEEMPDDIKGVWIGEDGTVVPLAERPKDRLAKGTAYLIAKNMLEGEVFGTVLHEVGVHAGMKDLVGKGYDKLLDRAWKLSQQDNDLGRRVRAHLDAERKHRPDVSDAILREEALAYLVEFQPQHSIVKRLLARLRAWLEVTFPGAAWLPNLTEADLQALALASLRRQNRIVGVGATKDVAPQMMRPKFSRADVAGAKAPDDVAAARQAWLDQGTDSPWFKRWFGESKVVGDDGKPLVVYHGTDRQFDVFNFTAGINAPVHQAVYFTDSPDVAGDVARIRWDAPQVVPAYLQMKHPLVLDAKGKHAIDMTGPVSRAFDPRKHDGVIIKNVREFQRDDLTTTYAVLRPEQIKSATGNRGTFDPQDARIQYSRRAEDIPKPTLPEPAADVSREHVSLVMDKITRRVPDADVKLRDFLDEHPAIREWSVYRKQVADAGLLQRQEEARAAWEAEAPVREAAKRAEAERYQAAKRGEVKLTKEEAVENFARWFGGSVITKDGELGSKPLKVTHETGAKFDAFDRGEFGFHFGVGIPEGMFGWGPRLHGYLRIENPLRMRDLGVWTPEAVIKTEFPGAEGRKLLAEVERIRAEENVKGTDPARTNYLASKPVHAALQAKEYDGIVYRNEAEGTADSYIIFEPEQFKSTRNVGTYDPLDARYRFSRAEPRVGRVIPQSEWSAAVRDGALDEVDEHLVVTHGMTVSNVKRAARRGGPIGPSIAIGKALHPVTDFGPVTLVADRRMVDPSTTQSFNADIYSPRTPRTQVVAIGERADELEREFVEAAGQEWVDRSQMDYDYSIIGDSPAAAIVFQQERGMPVPRFSGEYGMWPDSHGPINRAGLAVEFRDWLAEKVEKAGAAEEIIRGTRDTLATSENMLATMRASPLRGGEFKGDDWGNIRARIASQFETPEEMAAARGQVVPAPVHMEDRIGFDRGVDGVLRQLGEALAGDKPEVLPPELEAKVARYEAAQAAYNEKAVPYLKSIPSGPRPDAIVSMVDELHAASAVIRAEVTKRSSGFAEVGADGQAIVRWEGRSGTIPLREFLLGEVQAEHLRAFRYLDDVTLRRAVDKAVGAQPSTAAATPDLDQVASEVLVNLGVKPTARTPELHGAVKGLLDNLRDMSTEYFEAKPMRQLAFDEFEVAVVPKAFVADLGPIFSKSGLDIVEYDNDRDYHYAIAYAGKRANVLFSRRAETPDTPTRAEPFYSAVERAIDPAFGPAKKMKAGSFIAAVKKQPNVKQAEIDWMGMEAWATGKGTVTPEEARAFVDQNRVVVEEKVLGGEAKTAFDRAHRESFAAGDRLMAAARTKGVRVDLGDAIAKPEWVPPEVRAEADEYRAAYNRYQEMVGSASPTQYGTHVLPGGENYREVLLRQPVERVGPVKQAAVEAARKFQREMAVKYGEDPDLLFSGFERINERNAAWGRLRGAMTAEERAAEGRLLSPVQEYFTMRDTDPLPGRVYRGGHFSDDGQNLVVHLRVNDRVGPNGERLLHVEEVQSDWAADVRKKGVLIDESAGLPVEVMPDDLAVAETEYQWVVTHPDGREVKVGKGTVNRGEAPAYGARVFNRERLDMQREIAAKNTERVAPTPFPEDWHELAMKKALALAAEDGYDGITWTTGKMQQERYDLRKQLSAIQWGRTDGDTYWVQPIGLDGHAIPRVTKSGLKADDLGELIGKDAAKRIIDDPAPDGELTGDDLAIGGRWTEHLYDRMIPGFLGRYTKKWGARVGAVDIHATAKAVKSVPEEHSLRGAAADADLGTRQTEQIIEIARQGGPMDESVERLREIATSLPRDAVEALVREYRVSARAIQRAHEESRRTVPVHHIPVTDKMRASVAEGQPLFSRRRPEDAIEVEEVETKFSRRGQRSETDMQARERQLWLPGVYDRYTPETAETRLAAGELPEIVRRETGWFKGMDGKWRYEVSDAGAKMTDKARRYVEDGLDSVVAGDERLTLGDVLDHPKLYAAYPGLKDVPVYFYDFETGGSWTESGISIGTKHPRAAAGALPLMLHEVQHAIQAVEGFARGGTSASVAWAAPSMRPHLIAESARLAAADPLTVKEYAKSAWQSDKVTPAIRKDYKSNYLPLFQKNRDWLKNADIQKRAAENVYQRLAGEIEARDVANRAHMTDAELRDAEPAAWDDAIVVFRGETMKAKPEQARYSRRAEPAPTWYSGLRRAVEALKQDRFTPDQLRGMLAKAPGVKADEVKWTRLDEFLAGKDKVTKAEVLDWLDANKVELEEVLLGTPSSRFANRYNVTQETMAEAYERAMERRKDVERDAQKAGGRGDDAVAALERDPTDMDEALDLLNDAMARENDHGGEAVSWGPVHERMEELVSEARERAEIAAEESGDLVEPKLTAEEVAEIRQLVTEAKSRWTGLIWDEDIDVETLDGETVRIDINDLLASGLMRAEGPVKHGTLVLPGGENYRELLFKFPRGDGYAAPNAISHFPDDAKNLLAHVRFNDRTGPNGERILHVEEIQSDWHQAGRERGYRGQLPAGWKIEERQAAAGAFWRIVDERGNTMAAPYPSRAAAERNVVAVTGTRGVEGYRIPDAPFAKTWHEMVVKRMLRWAAENDYAAVTWTTGVQQVKRYEDQVRQVVDEIRWRKADDNSIVIEAVKDGRVVHNDAKSPEEMKGIIGGEMVKAIQASPDQSGTLRGPDLTVGGEGMKGFYDQMLPRWVDKYVRNWGAKVEKTTIPQEHDASINQPFESRDRAVTILTDGGEVYGVRYGNEELVETIDDLKTAEEEDGPFDSFVMGDKQPGAPVHMLRITPEMRRAVVEQGQPLFSRRAFEDLSFGREPREPGVYDEVVSDIHRDLTQTPSGMERIPSAFMEEPPRARDLAARSDGTVADRPADTTTPLPEFSAAMREDADTERISRRGDTVSERTRARFSRAAPPDTPEFKAWFRDSRVVNEQGTPRPVYHGTRFFGFDAFDPGRRGSTTRAPSAEMGFFFAGRPETASAKAYVDLAPEMNQEGALAVRAADQYIRDTWAQIRDAAMSDPEYASDIRSMVRDGFLDEQGDLAVSEDGMRYYGHDDDAVARAYGDAVKAMDWLAFQMDGDGKFAGYSEFDPETLRTLQHGWSTDDVVDDAAGSGLYEVYLSMRNPRVVDQGGRPYREEPYAKVIAEAKAAGHDGVIFKNTYDGGPLDDVFVVFEPEQVKFTTNERPTNDPRMAFSLRADGSLSGAFYGAANEPIRHVQTTARWLLELFQGADFRTLLHENGHLLQELVGTEGRGLLANHFDSIDAVTVDDIKAREARGDTAAQIAADLGYTAEVDDGAGGVRIEPDALVVENALRADAGERALTRRGMDQAADSVRRYLEVRTLPRGDLGRVIGTVADELADAWLSYRGQAGELPSAVRAYWDRVLRPTELARSRAVRLSGQPGRPEFPFVVVGGAVERAREADARRAMQSREASRTGGRPEELLQDMGLRAGEEIRFDDLVAHAVAQVVTEKARGWMVGKRLVVLTPRTVVPKERVRFVNDLANERLVQALGMTPQKAVDRLRDGKADAIRLDPATREGRFAQAGLRVYARELAAEPMATVEGRSLVPDLFLDPQSDLSVVSFDELRRLQELALDAAAGVGARRSQKAEAIPATMGAALVRAVFDAPDKLAKRKLKGTGGFLDGVAAKAKEMFVVEQPMEGFADPYPKEAAERAARMVAESPEWFKTQYRRQRRTLPFAQRWGVAANAPGVLETIRGVASQLTPPIAHNGNVGVVDSLVTLRDRYAGGAGNLTTLLDPVEIAALQDALDSWRHGLAAVEFASLQTLESYRGGAVATLTPNDTLVIEDAIGHIAIGLDDRMRVVDQRAREIALILAGSKDSNILLDKNLPQGTRLELYKAFFEGRWVETDAPDAGLPGAPRSLVSIAADKGLVTGREDLAYRPVKVDVDPAVVLVEMVVRMRANEILGQLGDELSRYGLYGKEPADLRTRDRFQSEVAGYINQIIGFDEATLFDRTAGVVVKSATGAGDLGLPGIDWSRWGGHPDTLRPHNMEAYRTAHEMLDRWGWRHAKGEWSVVQPGTDKGAAALWDRPILVPKMFEEHIRQSIDEAAKLGTAFQRGKVDNLIAVAKGRPTLTGGVDTTIQKLLSLPGDLYRNMKMGIVTGLYLPNTDTWVGNIMGGMLQVYQTKGLTGIFRMVRNPNQWRLAVGMVTRLWGDGRDLAGGGVLVTRDGRVYGVNELVTMAREHGLDSSLAKAETARSLVEEIKREHSVVFGKTLLSPGFYQDQIVNAYTSIDNFHRAQVFLDELRQGADPSRAAEMARIALFDYSRLTKFEKTVMRRVCLFYAFERANQTLFWWTLLNHPSRVMGQVRLVRDLKREWLEEDWRIVVPEYHEGKFMTAYESLYDSGPITGRGVELDGTRFQGTAYISKAIPAVDGFRLWADIYDVAAGGGPEGRKGAAANLLSKAHPLVQAPIVGATGVEIFSGRKVDDPKQVPMWFIQQDRALTGGVIVHDILKVKPVFEPDPARRQDPDIPYVWRTDEGYKWWIIQNLGAAIPGMGRSITTMDTIDRATDHGPTWALVRTTQAARELAGMERAPEHPYLPETGAAPRAGMTQGDELWGLAGFKAWPIKTRGAVREDILKQINAEMADKNRGMKGR